MQKKLKQASLQDLSALFPELTFVSQGQSQHGFPSPDLRLEQLSVFMRRAV